MAVPLTQVGLSLFPMLLETIVAGSGKEKSLIQATKGARFEPIALVDRDAADYENIKDVMQTMNTLFTGYLLQAIQLHGSVGGVKYLKELEQFNPSREPSFGDFRRRFANALEDFGDTLPTPLGNMALESLDTDPDKRAMTPARRAALEEAVSGVRQITENENWVDTSVNLAVGRMYNVDFGPKGQSVSVPISVRLLPMLVPSARLAHILTVDSKKLTSLKERWYAARRGTIGYSDLFFMKDLLKQYRREGFADKDGLYAALIQRKNANAAAAITSGQASMAASSNILVMTTDTARLIEEQIGGRLHDFNTREKLFASTGLMLVAVIDKIGDRVVIYHESISQESNLSIREVKNSSKDSGASAMEILKAYMQGASPL